MYCMHVLLWVDSVLGGARRDRTDRSPASREPVTPRRSVSMGHRRCSKIVHVEKPRDRPTADDRARASPTGRGGMTRPAAPTASAVAIGIFFGLGALVALWLLAYPLALL